MDEHRDQQIGKYRLLKRLGRGGIAEVYLGEDRYSNIQVAIKILNTKLISTSSEMFINAVHTMARLDHPHIVHLYELGEQDRIPYFVMSYAPNGSVRQWNGQGSRMEVGTIITYMKQIATALQYAHSQNIVHQHLTPQNILLGANGEVLLSDFGLPSSSLLYTAPEQFVNEPQAASDQYALGVTVYEWLCGAPPFTGTARELAEQHIEMTPPPLREKIPTLSPLVEQVVMTALAKNPKDRYDNIMRFVVALEQAFFKQEM